MKIVLGSTNTDKKKIVKKAFKELRLSEVNVECVKASSNIDDQPLNNQTTKRGAINRARNAKKKEPNADFWIGLEGGLHDHGEGYHLVTHPNA